MGKDRRLTASFFIAARRVARSFFLLSCSSRVMNGPVLSPPAGAGPPALALLRAPPSRGRGCSLSPVTSARKRSACISIDSWIAVASSSPPAARLFAKPLGARSGELWRRLWLVLRTAPGSMLLRLSASWLCPTTSCPRRSSSFCAARTAVLSSKVRSGDRSLPSSTSLPPLCSPSRGGVLGGRPLGRSGAVRECTGASAAPSVAMTAGGSRSGAGVPPLPPSRSRLDFSFRLRSRSQSRGFGSALADAATDSGLSRGGGGAGARTSPASGGAPASAASLA